MKWNKHSRLACLIILIMLCTMLPITALAGEGTSIVVPENIPSALAMSPPGDPSGTSVAEEVYGAENLLATTYTVTADSVGVWDGSSVDVSWYNTTDTAFNISTPAQLAGLAAIVNGTAAGITRDDFTGKNISLTSDIDLGSREWTPVGFVSVTVMDSTATISIANSLPFNGTFSGGGYTVKNLSISGTKSGIGLFGYVGNSGIIQDVAVSGTVSGAYYVAGAASVCAGTIKNVINQVVVSATNDCVGGILAEGLNGIHIIACHNRALVSNNSNTKSSGRIGGIVGRIDTGAAGIINQCSNEANITGYQYVAGIIGGQFGNVDVSECYNTGDITGISFGKVYLGGIAGKSESGTINNCYNTGDLYDAHWAPGHIRAVGGIAGCEEGRSDETTAITNCYTTGKITFNTSNMTCGSNWIYEVGNISGGNSATSANMMGYKDCFYLDGSIEIADEANESYQFWADIYKDNPLLWDTTYITGKTDEEMKSPEFPFSISNAFCSDDENVNDGYPILQWQLGQAVPETEYALTVSTFGSDTASANLSQDHALPGEEITLSVTGIEAGRQIKSVTVKDVAGNIIVVTAQGDGSFSFTMPSRDATVAVVFENSATSGQNYILALPEGLDHIWNVNADSTYMNGSMVKAGATVNITVSKAQGALMSSLKGISVKQTPNGDEVNTQTQVYSKDSNNSGYYGVYSFTMPESDVVVNLEIEYTPFKVYVQEGSTGTPELVKTYSREEMLALARSNLYYTGYASEQEAFIGKADLAVTMTDLLNDAKLALDQNSSIEVTAADGMNLYYSYNELYGSPRYYYPNIISGQGAAAKAAGKSPVDSMFVIKGYMASASEGSVEDKVTDTLYAYRFGFGQTETEFNNGQPALEYKVDSYMPKCVNALTIIKSTSPSLTADSQDNRTGQDVTLTFSENPAWRGAIIDITVNGASIAGQYSITPGAITMNASVFTAAGNYAVVVKASGYNDAEVTQVMQAAVTLEPGDINGDGVVNNVDVVKAVNFALEISTPIADQFQCADMNGDGIINNVDVVKIVNKALQS
ncbi:MAG TPA: DUF1533 domain-containing protein [Syntrophomonadaceae bacterium]|nr:DUF1533 domain-containing protein [Syntrophomonadaceae bacterium]